MKWARADSVDSNILNPSQIIDDTTFDITKLKKSDLVSLLVNVVKETLAGFIDQMQSNQINLISDSVKSDHYGELKRLKDKSQRLKNSRTTLYSYKSNQVLPKSLSRENFPFPMYSKDKVFVDKFNAMIKRFQLDILDFTIKYVEEQLDELEKEIIAKIKSIKSFDKEADSTITITDNDVFNKYKHKLEQSQEKVNRLIGKNDESDKRNNNRTNDHKQRSNNYGEGFNRNRHGQRINNQNSYNNLRNNDNDYIERRDRKVRFNTDNNQYNQHHQRNNQHQNNNQNQHRYQRHQRHQTQQQNQISNGLIRNNNNPRHHNNNNYNRNQ
jgi:hypothetical protein